MQAATRWRRLAAITGALALATGGVALVPGASAAAPTHSCGTKTLTEKLPGPASEPSATQTFHIQIKAITTQGISCTAAVKFLTKLYGQGQKTTPEGYVCKNAKFKAPPGTVPTVCSKPGKKIQFAGQGG